MEQAKCPKCGEPLDCIHIATDSEALQFSDGTWSKTTVPVQNILGYVAGCCCEELSDEEVAKIVPAELLKSQNLAYVLDTIQLSPYGRKPLSALELLSRLDKNDLRIVFESLAQDMMQEGKLT